MSTTISSTLAIHLISLRLKFLLVAFLTGAIAESGSAYGAGSVSGGAVLVDGQIEELLGSTVFDLSSGEESLQKDFQFVFSLGAKDTLLGGTNSKFSFDPTLNEVISSGGKAGVIIRTPNGLPFGLIIDDLLVVCDSANPGGLAYFEQSTFEWKFSPGENSAYPVHANYSVRIVFDESSSRIDLDLKKILESAYAGRREFKYNETDRILSFSDNGQLFEIEIASADSLAFGVKSINIMSPTVPNILIDGFHTGSTSYKALFDISVSNLASIGLPLRAVSLSELRTVSNNLAVPKGFPRQEEELRAAEKLKLWIDSLKSGADKTGNPNEEILVESALTGDSLSQIKLALLYLNGSNEIDRDYSEALRWLKPAADQQDPKAQFLLGGLYSEGIGVTQDYEESFLWFSKAGDQGYAPAQWGIAYCYANGFGVEQDDQIAIQWLIKSVEQEYAEAQYLLGRFYLEGKGVPVNTVKAVELFRQSAEQGHAPAQLTLAVLLLSDDFLDPIESWKWVLLAAEQQEPLALRWLNESPPTTEDENQKQLFNEAKRRADNFVPKPSAVTAEEKLFEKND